jgi:hypothetical protein
VALAGTAAASVAARAVAEKGLRSRIEAACIPVGECRSPAEAEAAVGSRDRHTASGHTWEVQACSQADRRRPSEEHRNLHDHRNHHRRRVRSRRHVDQCPKPCQHESVVRRTYGTHVSDGIVISFGLY